MEFLFTNNIFVIVKHTHKFILMIKYCIHSVQTNLQKGFRIHTIYLSITTSTRLLYLTSENFLNSTKQQ